MMKEKKTDKLVEFYHQSNEVMDGAIEQLIVQLYQQKTEGADTFLFTGCGHGVGTTTIAVNTARNLAACGWKVALIDCDVRKKILYKRLNVTLHTGLTDYLKSEIKENSILYATKYPNLSYIPAGNETDYPIPLFCSGRMKELLESLKKEFDYIFLDVSPVNIEPEVGILIPFVDRCMLVAGIGITSKKQLQQAKKKMQEYKERYIGLIVNRVQKQDYKSHQNGYDYYDKKKQSQNYIKMVKDDNHKRGRLL